VVICLRLLCVSSWVMNFWITSLTSATPVASLIFLNASSNVTMRAAMASICRSLASCCKRLAIRLRLSPSSSSLLMSPAASIAMRLRSASRACILAFIS